MLSICCARRALCVALILVSIAAGAKAADRPLIDLAKEVGGKRIVVSTPGEVSVVPAQGAPGVVVTCRPGKDSYPGVTLKPEGAVWDLSAFGHIDAKITNTGTTPITVALRVDNAGDWKDSPWSSENGYPKPGETVMIRVRFGYAWGKPAFKLNPAKITQLLMFTTKAQAEQSFRIESIVAGGDAGEKPPVNPADVRTRPKDGIILGRNTGIDLATQIETQNAHAQRDGDALRVSLPAGDAEASVQIKPAVGRWDLRDALQVTVEARNAGSAPVTLKARLESGSGGPEWVRAGKPMAPGASQTLILPFAGSMITLSANGKKTGGTSFESDRASGVRVAADGDGERAIVISLIRASVPPPPTLPAWLGKRPPAPGEWKQTMAEEFNGPEIDEKLWTIYHPNYWDKSSHFSKANDILGGGVLRLRFEKKRGHADDDPAKPETDWATGFLTGTHKWTQRYGYFECRQKLPHAPGMWPAFWMMPDRGEAAGAAREDTRNGGMEFDILEYLARYGPYRYNIACHWDGYDKDHKSTGTDLIYVQPDKDGFFTAGLLWEPGKVTWYCNGAPIVQWEDARVASVPEYILFTAVSGGWGGNDLTGEGLPSDYVLDYVRAWQRSDWADATAP